VTGRWFSPGTSVYSTNKTDRHDITTYSCNRHWLHRYIQLYRKKIAPWTHPWLFNVFFSKYFYQIIILTTHYFDLWSIYITGSSINRSNLIACLLLSQDRILISNAMCRGLLCLQWFEARGSCSFCRYWWHCWPWLNKLSFHNCKWIIKE
jgi:hypothetical protein